jgi:hypothetical protein
MSTTPEILTPHGSTPTGVFAAAAGYLSAVEVHDPATKQSASWSGGTSKTQAEGPIHIISLGAGVQSSTMALMAAHGEITPMPTAAVFADTHAEPESVYRWLEWLETKLPFPVHRVSKGDLARVSLTVRDKKDGTGKWVKSLIPAFIQNPDGSRGIMGRACTFDYKVMQLEAAAKRIGEIKRNQKTVGVIQWIGISLDEAHRMKPARKAWVEHRWPLIDAGMKRHDCLRWMERMGYPKPPRSACIYCPFHSDAEWRRLKDEEPKEFARAVQFERDLQHAKSQTDNQRGKPFLHNSLKPLDQVDLSTDIERGQGEMFGNDCTGLCGV